MNLLTQDALIDSGIRESFSNDSVEHSRIQTEMSFQRQCRCIARLISELALASLSTGHTEKPIMDAPSTDLSHCFSNDTRISFFSRSILGVLDSRDGAPALCSGA